ncbi:sulfotransferase family 2 domain-containing protein [Nioella sp.]|uniref:sulfotransferase family 2 domain-containing protein n=1 Tax=Nioella sp. TaxID=1912091 RepID=UPI003A88C484
MIFPNNRLLFIHVPKTGGNFFTRCFLAYSSESMHLGAHRDGIDRFELRGEYTRNKHQQLRSYAEILGESLGEYTVLAIARPPVERLLSFYFSPHRLLKKRRDETSEIDLDQAATFDLATFRQIAEEQPSISQFLDSANLDRPLHIERPARHASGALVRLIDFKRLSAEIGSVAREYGFSMANIPDRPVNRSANPTLKDRLAERSDEMWEIVAQTHHARDQDIFH